MELQEFEGALKRAQPARFKPADMDELKRYLVTLIREHVRANYRSQAAAATAFETTQARMSYISTGRADTVTVEALLSMAIRAGLIRKIEVRVE